MSVKDWSNQFFTGPASVEARKNRYLPPASKTGSPASARPSVSGMRLVLVQGIEPDRLEPDLVGQRVGEPAGIRRPARAHGLDRAVDRLGGDPLDRAGGEVDPGQGAGIVQEGDLLAVRRPDRPLVEPGPLEGVGLAARPCRPGAARAGCIPRMRRRSRRSTCRRATRWATARGRRASR